MKKQVILAIKHQYRGIEYPPGALIGIVDAEKNVVKAADGFDAARVAKCLAAGIAKAVDEPEGKPEGKTVKVK